MKACPVCGRLYPADAGFCPVDGSALSSVSHVPVAADAADPRVGNVLCARYQVRRVVADGGMGRVYEALDLHLRRNVALKVLHPDVAGDDVAVARFRREYQVSQQLPHDHIVEVLDFQPTGDGTYALAMEFLYGEELRATLKREAVLPPGRIVRMLSQVAIGLDEAHAKKFIHRDLKPDNLFLCQTSDGDTVKLLDFGSVKDKSEGAKKLTVMGTTIGSPFYMAPEQAKGEDTLDQRADVWALAAIAYECVTGQVPFKGINGPSILLEILTKEPTPPSQMPSQRHPVPPTLDRVMASAFKKLPSLRIGSVGALADAVGAAYGLQGAHQSWAVTPEAQLSAAIAEALPAVMAQVAAPAGPVDAADSFFGEMDSLGATGGMGDPAPPLPAPSAAAPAAWQQPQAQMVGGWQGDYAAEPVVPKQVPIVVILLAVGFVALLVGAGVVWLVLR